MKKILFVLAGLILVSFPSLLAQLPLRHSSSPTAYTSGTDPEEEEEEEEDEFRGFSFGLNIGSYIGSAKTGNFYNGDGIQNFPDNPNGVLGYSIYERLSQPVLTQQEFSYITGYYNAASFEVPYDSSPLNMKYNPSFMVGLQVKYNFTRYAALVFNVNSMKLKAASQFTLRCIGTGAQQNAQQDIRLFNITGNEQRFNFNLGYRQGWEINPITNFYLQLGGSMLGTKVERNQIFVAERTYDLFVGASNPYQLLPYQPRTDIGFGFYLAPGFEFFIKDKYTFDISFGMSRDKIILISEETKAWNKWLQASFTL
ncbi:MAG: outer membrane beta-barrel protein [Crocinitomicaceae bacterium]|nr:outer membrane beta-barrel protein [Crocinitomicaceae bacterium]